VRDDGRRVCGREAGAAQAADGIVAGGAGLQLSDQVGRQIGFVRVALR